MPFASDAFTGTGGTALESYSSSWTKVSGGSGTQLSLNANTLYPGGTSGWQMYQWNAAQATSADYEIQADFTIGSSGNVGPGVCGRLVSGSNNDCYFADWHSGSWYLWKRVGGSVSSIGSYAGDIPTTTKTAVLRMVGTTISVHVGGVQRISVTDSSLSAKGYAGVGSYYPDNNTTRYIDNWSATDGTAAGSLFRQSLLNGLGSGGPFFNNPLG